VSARRSQQAQSSSARREVLASSSTSTGQTGTTVARCRPGRARCRATYCGTAAKRPVDGAGRCHDEPWLSAGPVLLGESFGEAMNEVALPTRGTVEQALARTRPVGAGGAGLLQRVSHDHVLSRPGNGSAQRVLRPSRVEESGPVAS